MEMERIERAYELLSVTEKNHTQTIRNAYRKVIKINKKNETLTPELSSEAKAAMYLLIERRKRMKSEVVIQRDAQLHDEIRVRMNAKKFFAPRLWFKIALPIIICDGVKILLHFKCCWVICDDCNSRNHWTAN
jgi:hypothetical protein